MHQHPTGHCFSDEFKEDSSRAFDVHVQVFAHIVHCGKPIPPTVLPGVLGALMAFAGLGWLTFLSASVASRLQPYNLVPGLIGEGALTVWLLLKGVNEQRWHEQARAAGMPKKAAV